MSDQELVSTPELSQFDSFPSTPESWYSSEPSEFPLPDTSARPDTSLVSPNVIDKNMEDVLRIFIDTVFENDEISRPYLSLLSDEEKSKLKSEVLSSQIFSLGEQFIPQTGSSSRSSGFSDVDQIVPTDNVLGCPGTWDHVAMITSADLDSSFLPIDPSTYFDFDGIYAAIKSISVEGAGDESMESFLQLPNTCRLTSSFSESSPAVPSIIINHGASSPGATRCH